MVGTAEDPITKVTDNRPPRRLGRLFGTANLHLEGNLVRFRRPVSRPEIAASLFATDAYLAVSRALPPPASRRDRYRARTVRGGSTRRQPFSIVE